MGNLEFGLNTTSQIESLWKSIKNKIKKTYNIKPNINFFKFLQEAESKFNTRNLNLESKIKEFFVCFEYNSNLSDIILKTNEFLSNYESD